MAWFNFVPRFVLTPVLAAFAVLVLSTAVRADTIIFNNLPANGNARCLGLVCGYSGAAAKFIPDANYTLDQVSFVLSGGGTDPGLTIEMLNDSGNGLWPGSTVLESWSSMPVPTGPTLVTVTDSTGLSLKSGTIYWAAVIAPPLNDAGIPTFYLQYLSDGPVAGSASSSYYGSGTWSESSLNLAFEVTGSPTSTRTPEPGSVFLLGIGILGVLFLRRRILRSC